MRPALGRSPIQFTIDGQIARADIPQLCERVRAMLTGADADRLVCDVGAVLDPDAVTVDALARLQLTARRLGRRMRLRDASGELQGLLALMGLSDVLPVSGGSGFGARRQAEEREETRRVQEEADPADPAV
jgi:ABC-type transporter Mla MlaB component